MGTDPFLKFEDCYRKECELSDSPVPTACCLSTMGEDGYPNARFVSLKDVSDERFLITGPLQSRKGKELNLNPRAALTFWWPVIEMQVRIQGDVRKIDPLKADLYFRERSRKSQIVSTISRQGRPISDRRVLEERYNRFSELYSAQSIPRPVNWGGFAIIPIRIEFLTFKSSRLHERELYLRSDISWTTQQLQP
jgi:pyridoxamine 5'-phosphate oxidase